MRPDIHAQVRSHPEHLVSCLADADGSLCQRCISTLDGCGVVSPTYLIECKSDCKTYAWRLSAVLRTLAEQVADTQVKKTCPTTYKNDQVRQA